MKMTIDAAMKTLEAYHEVVRANAPQSIDNLREEGPIEHILGEVTWELIETAIDQDIIPLDAGDDPRVWRSMSTAARTYIELARSLDFEEVTA